MSTAGKVVAELKFAFWIAMLTSRHDGGLWTPWIKAEFPESRTLPPSECRNMLHVEMGEIRKLRHRIAHHEPVFGRDLSADYGRIRQVIAWRSRAAADWTHREQGVTELLASRP